MKSRACVLLAALLFASGLCRAGDPDVRFFRKKLQSKTMETAWYRYKPGSQAVFDHVHPILARQGLALDKDYFLDRNDVMGVLAVTGPPEAVNLVLRVIAFLDEKRPQISINLRIAETLVSGDIQSGIDIGWDRKTSERTFFRGFEMNNQPQAYLDSLLSPSIPFQGTATSFGTVDSAGNIVNQEQYDKIGALYMAIRAVSEYQNSEILAQPNIMVTNGEQAAVITGAQYPFQQVTFTGTTAVISTQFKDVGITLKVTPWIIGERRIKMALEASVTNVVGFVEITQGVKNPYLDERFIKNTVMLDSGTTLAIGGLFQKETTVVEKGVPVLSDIPLLGLLFKSYWTKKQKKELRIYVTPRLIQPCDRFFIPEAE